MKITLSALCFTIVVMASLAWAEHPGVATAHRDSFQNAMAMHIEEVTEQNGNGMYPVFDPETKTVVQLKFKEFHDSVKIRGKETPYFISCADFTAEDGTLYDLDFLVSPQYGIVGTLVHSKNGEYISYEIP